LGYKSLGRHGDICKAVGLEVTVILSKKDRERDGVSGVRGQGSGVRGPVFALRATPRQAGGREG